jgi:hypothetical protein
VILNAPYFGSAIGGRATALLGAPIDPKVHAADQLPIDRLVPASGFRDSTLLAGAMTR